MLDDSKKFKWGAKKLNYMVGNDEYNEYNEYDYELGSGKKVCSSGCSLVVCDCGCLQTFPISVLLPCILVCMFVYES